MRRSFSEIEHAGSTLAGVLSRIPRFARGIAAPGLLLGLIFGLSTLGAWPLAREPSAPSLPPLARRRIAAPSNLIASLVFHPKDGNLISAYSGLDSIWVWHPGSGGRRRFPDEPSSRGWGVRHLALSPSGTTLAAGFFVKGVALWDLEGGEEGWRRLEPESWNVRGVAFTPNGHTLVGVGVDSRIRTWDAATWKETRVWSAPFEPNTHPGVAPDGRTLVVGGVDGRLGRWEIATGHLVAEWRGHDQSILAVAHSPDGSSLISSGLDRSVPLWDAATHTERQSLSVEGRPYVWCLAYSPDGTVLATGDGVGAVCLWDATTGRLSRRLVGHRGIVRSLAFAPDSRTLASGGSDGTIFLWDVAAAPKGNDVTTRGIGPSENLHEEAEPTAASF